MCVDEEHVRALAYQAAEWHKPGGIKPVGSAVATAHIVNKPDLKSMSKNKKKKMKKKEKIKQKMLELTQQQIQDAEKQKQNLLSSPDQINLNKMTINDEKKQNGHDENSPDESDDEIPTISQPVGDENNNSQETASAADPSKLPELAESDASAKREWMNERRQF